MRVRKFPDSLSWTPAHTAVYSTRSAHPSLTTARATTVGLTHTSYTRTMPAAGGSSTSGWPCREPLCTGTFTPSQNVVSGLMTRHSARLDLVLEHAPPHVTTPHAFRSCPPTTPPCPVGKEQRHTLCVRLGCRRAAGCTSTLRATGPLPATWRRRTRCGGPSGCGRRSSAQVGPRLPGNEGWPGPGGACVQKWSWSKWVGMGPQTAVRMMRSHQLEALNFVAS